MKYAPALPMQSHQRSGLAFMMGKNTINADEQGLGKTKQACDVAGALFENKQIDLCIVVAKASLRSTLASEFKKNAPQLLVRFVEGSQAQRHSFYVAPSCHVLIVSFETLVNDHDEVGELLANNRVYVVVDEAHYLKNPETRRAITALRTLSSAVKIDLLSGTIAPNDIGDIFVPLKLCGADVGDTLAEFRQRFTDVESVREIMKPHVIRRQKTAVSTRLPTKTVVHVPVELLPEERALYDRLASQVRVELESKGRTAVIDMRTVLARLVRLLQFTSSPANLFPNYGGKSAKLIALDHILASTLRNPTNKVIIWTHHRRTLALLEQRLSKLEPLVIHGGVSRGRRDVVAADFMHDKGRRVLIATPQTAREGFTFTSANYAVFFDRDFSLLNWLQAQDRIHRISQTRAVKIIVLAATGTIDCRVDEILTRKTDTLSQLVDGVPGAKSRNKIPLRDILSWIQ